MSVPVLTICCAMHNKEVQRTKCCDVSEQTGNLTETVNSKIALHIQTATISL